MPFSFHCLTFLNILSTIFNFTFVNVSISLCVFRQTPTLLFMLFIWQKHIPTHIYLSLAAFKQSMALTGVAIHDWDLCIPNVSFFYLNLVYSIWRRLLISFSFHCLTLLNILLSTIFNFTFVNVSISLCVFRQTTTLLFLLFIWQKHIPTHIYLSLAAFKQSMALTGVG